MNSKLFVLCNQKFNKTFTHNIQLLFFYECHIFQTRQTNMLKIKKIYFYCTSTRGRSFIEFVAAINIILNSIKGAQSMKHSVKLQLRNYITIENSFKQKSAFA